MLRRDHRVISGAHSDDRPEEEREDMGPMRGEPGESTVSSTQIAISPPYRLAVRSYGLPTTHDDTGALPASGPIDRDQLLDRLQRLRAILPVFAQELASARRQAAALRVENRGLLEEVRRLQAQHGQGTHAGG